MALNSDLIYEHSNRSKRTAASVCVTFGQFSELVVLHLSLTQKQLLLASLEALRAIGGAQLIGKSEEKYLKVPIQSIMRAIVNSTQGSASSKRMMHIRKSISSTI